LSLHLRRFILFAGNTCEVIVPRSAALNLMSRGESNEADFREPVPASIGGASPLK